MAVDASFGAAALAATYPPVEVETDARVDTVTVGQRFHVAWRFTYPESLILVVPGQIDAGTCRLVHAEWNDAPLDGLQRRAADLVFIPLSVDSAVVPSNRIAFVTPSGDSIFARTDAIGVPIRRIAAESKDTRGLKEQWTPKPNYLLWGLVALLAAAILAAAILYVRKRRARIKAELPAEPALPAHLAALAELDRIATLGLVECGDFKTYYTLVVDVIRRYLEPRFGVVAMDRTTWELLDDLAARDVRIEGLGQLLEEADLVKFAKLTPAPSQAHQALARARDIVRATVLPVAAETVAPPARTEAS